MCGRFALGLPRKRLKERFGLEDIPDAPERYNIAPGQMVEAVTATPAGRGMRLFKWGLVPSWAKDTAIGYKMINARAETAAEKPAFRAAMRYRRCLIPAQGFYEWSSENGRRQPWFLSRQDGGVLALAGIWEHHEGPQGGVLESVAILTCQANSLVAGIHDRMPVIVEPGDDARWLDPGTTRADALRDILEPREWPGMRAYRVGTLVNSPRHEGQELLDPLPDMPGAGLLD